MLHSVKAQAMIEYLIYFGISFVVFIALTTFVFLYENTEVQELRYSALNERASEIQSMFLVFAQMNPTFTQTVEIKETVNGDQYGFRILASNLYITQNDLEVILPLPPITGNTTNKTFTIIVTEAEVILS